MPQAALAATSELVTRTNAFNLSADTPGEGDTHGASSAFPKPAMLTFLEGQAVRVEERGRIGTPVYYRRILLHARFIARQVQHRVVFGETQDLPRLPRLAARSH